MLRNYFKIAWRNLTKHKASGAINILGLAIGVTSCMIIYSIASFELSYDTFHPERDRIYRIVRDYQRSGSGDILHLGTVNSPTPMAVRANLTGFETIAGFHSYFSRVIVPEGSKEARKFAMPAEGKDVPEVIVTEPQYFDIFKYQWLAGNASTSLDAPFKVVLTASQAKKYFGDLPWEKMIGKEVIYADSLHVAVSGIVKDWDKNTDFTFTDFISLSTVSHSFLKNQINLDNSGIMSRFSQAFVKLAKGVTPGQAEAALRKFVGDHKVEVGLNEGDRLALRLQPLSDIHFNENYKDAYSRKVHLPTLYSLMALAAFILMIAAINFVNLATAHSMQRAKEIGIRKVLGSNRKNIVFQFLTETLLTTCFAVLLSLLMVNPALALFHSFIPPTLSFHFYKPATLLFSLLLILFTSLLAGFYPAWVLSSYLPALSLKGKGSTSDQKYYLRKALIIFQFTVSLVFIIGTIVINAQIHLLQNKDLGFTKDAIINIPTSGRYQFPNYPGDKRGDLAGAIRQLPEIKNVSVSRSQLADIDHQGITITQQAGKGRSIFKAQILQGDMDLIPLYGLKLLAGRDLLKSDTIKEFVINETCARMLGYKTPREAVGQFVAWDNGSTTPIVGVVADFNSQPLHDPIAPTVITTNTHLIAGCISVKLPTNGKNTDQFKSILAKIEALWSGVYPNEPFQYSFFDQDIARFYEKEERTAQTVNTAMAIAIFISCMGLFGLATFTARQRTKEIGIRKVLGASITGIVSMLSKEFLKLVLLSFLIASPVAYYFMHRWLHDFAYRIDISWWIFALAGSGAILIALLTVSFQAIKAAVANPVKSLRTE